MLKGFYRSSFSMLIVGLVVLGLGLILYRHLVSGVSLMPNVKEVVWSVEAKIEFEAQGDPVKVSFALPPDENRLDRIAERTASPGYGLQYVDQDGGRRAEWTVRAADKKQTLYYAVDLYQTPKPSLDLPPIDNAAIEPPKYLGALKLAAEDIVAQAFAASADNAGFANALVRLFDDPDQQVQLLLRNSDRYTRILELLVMADIPIRPLRVLVLKDGARRQALRSWIQIFDNQRSIVIDPSNNYQPKNQDWFVWEAGGYSVIDLIGGHETQVSFSMLKRRTPMTALNQMGVGDKDGLWNLSIHSLPLEEQAVFKAILLVPVGVLLVVLMRTLVGLRTSGTFMPVLIALAFMQTTLLPGLLSFLLIVAAGLVIRSYFSRHNLLLVARISVVIISVVLILVAFSVLAYRLGLAEGLTLTLFPMIIISWTIERMSLLWEEEGPREVLAQGGGSMLVALLTYGLMMNSWVQHWTFNFIGLQFLLMAAILLCGSYTGYRLSELRRFFAFTQSS